MSVDIKVFVSKSPNLKEKVECRYIETFPVIFTEGESGTTYSDILINYDFKFKENEIYNDDLSTWDGYVWNKVNFISSVADSPLKQRITESLLENSDPWIIFEFF